MHMHMLMLGRVVPMFVDMVLGQVQKYADRHQAATCQQCGSHRLAE